MFWTHDQLCERATKWLSGQRCNPVFRGVASASEVPDAIGWSSRWNCEGSIVVECKVSLADFRADSYKRFPSKLPDKDCTVCEGRGWEDNKQRKVCLCRKPLKMGSRRYFMVPEGIVSLADMERYPDHGLLYVRGARRVIVMKPAPERAEQNFHTELRLLRFAIINQKENLSSMHGWPIRKET